MDGDTSTGAGPAAEVQQAPQYSPEEIQSISEALANAKINADQQNTLIRVLTKQRDELEARCQVQEAQLSAFGSRVDKEIAALVAEKKAAGLSDADAIEVSRRQIAQDRKVAAEAEQEAKRKAAEAKAALLEKKQQ
jgi:hypothetical protein